MGFTHLHCHDTYSTLDGAMITRDMIARAKELGQTAIAQTNHGTLAGVIQFLDECKKSKIKGIAGYEAYVSPGLCSVKEKIEDTPYAYHLVLLAMNEVGLKNLIKLSSMAYTEGFYYKPRVDHILLEKYNEGLICLSGCIKGKVPWLLHKGDKEGALKEAKKLKKIFKDRFYIELQRIGMQAQEDLIEPLIYLAEELNVPYVATCDAHYLKKEDAPFHEQMLCLQTGKKLIDKDRMHLPTEEFYLKSEEEMLKLFEDYPRAIENTMKIAERCNLVLKDKYEHIFPTFGKNDKADFIKRARKGLQSLNLTSKTYTDRLEEEIKTIVKMGFPSYFLVVSDFISWARAQGITVGPGRGSVAGSLVAYVLGITEIDPIRYGLLFSRFLNQGRKSVPDIDSDFCQNRRHEVLEYISKKYGEDKVAHIITFPKFKPRGSVKNFARVQDETIALGEKASKLVPLMVRGREPTWEEAIKASPALLSGEFKDMVKMARKSAGLIKTSGSHAAGIVISDKPLTDTTPLCFGKDKVIHTQWDMDDLERMGLVKMDLLGLTALTTMSTCLKLIEKTTGEKIDISKVPEDDSKVFDLICSGDVSGMFQIEAGGGIRELTMKFKPRSIEDLAVINALYRPGPLDSGMDKSYLRRKYHQEPITYLTPKLKPILKPTLGLMVYQEQAMKIATDLASYSLEEADSLRYAIGKKKPKAMAEHKKKLIAGMVQNNIKKDIATKIWQEIKQFADYSFNASHAISYSTITYRTAYLKTYYPTEFYCALLSLHMDERDKTVKYLADCKAADIQVLPPDINESDTDFTVYKGVIRFGFAGIKGIGEKAASHLVATRKGNYKNLLDFYERTRDIGTNKRTMEALAKAGAFDSFDISRAASLLMIEELITYSKKLKSYEKKLETYKKKVVKYDQREEERTQAKKPKPSLKEPVKPEVPAEVIVPDVKEMELDSLLALEREVLGVYVTSHPLYNYSMEIFKLADTHTASLIDHVHGEYVTLLGLIASVKRIRTKKGAQMATLDLEDLNGFVQATVFPGTYASYKDVIEEGAIVLLSGKVERIDEKNCRLVAINIQEPPSPKKPEPNNYSVHMPTLSLVPVETIKNIINKYPGDKYITVTFNLGGCLYTLEETAKISKYGLKLLRNIQGVETNINS